MKTTNYTVQVIEPAEGYTLTQAADVEVLDRILSKKIFLAVTDSSINWKEITDLEAEELRLEQDRLAKEELDKIEANE